MGDYFAGIDIGSTMTKVVIINTGIVASIIGSSGAEHRKLASKVMEQALAQAGIGFNHISSVIATGYGRLNVPFADKQITEISCQAKGISTLFPSAKALIDIGGQDCKCVKIANGKAIDFVMNDKCAAGTGRFLEVMAQTLGVKLEELGELSLQAKKAVEISSTCTLFAAQEVANNLSKGVPLEDLLAGIHESIASRIYNLSQRLRIKEGAVITGGGAKNIGLVHYLEKKLAHRVIVAPEPLTTAALGAALLGKELTQGGQLAKANRQIRKVTLYS